MEPRMGASVRIWPRHGRVQAGMNAFGKFLPYPLPDGQSVVWDRHWSARFKDGDVALQNPHAEEIG